MFDANFKSEMSDRHGNTVSRLPVILCRHVKIHRDSLCVGLHEQRDSKIDAEWYHSKTITLYALVLTAQCMIKHYPGKEGDRVTLAGAP